MKDHTNYFEEENEKFSATTDSTTYDNDSGFYRDDEEQNKKKKNRLPLLVILFLVGLAGIVAIAFLYYKNKNNVAYYEDYIRQSRDSVLLAVADLNIKIEQLQLEKTKLTGEVSDKDAHLAKLNKRISSLLATWNPQKYQYALAKIAELENHIITLNKEITELRAEVDRLRAENRVYVDQIKQCNTSYEDLQKAFEAAKAAELTGTKSKKAKKDEAETASTTTTDIPQAPVGEPVVAYGDDYSVNVQNTNMRFIALDKKGREVTKVNKIRLNDVKTFSISFDATATKSVNQLFYVRITDSVQGNLVVATTYIEDVKQNGKKLLKLPSGEELPYSFSFTYYFKDANQMNNVLVAFDPIPTQIRYLPYRIEIYDGRGKLSEVYVRPPTKKR